MTKLRSKLFSCAAVFSYNAGKPMLKLAVVSTKRRHWRQVPLQQMVDHDDCYAVTALAARADQHDLILPSIT